MPLAGSTAKRYAEALLELAVESADVDAFSAALERIARAVGPEALRLLAAPSFPLAARQAALEHATAGEPSVIRTLLETLLVRRRIALLPAIARAYRDLLDEREGIVKVVITTAIPLDQPWRREIMGRLEREIGRRLRARFTVDPAIQGGLVVRIGDHQVDGSVHTRLAVLRQQLAQGT